MLNKDLFAENELATPEEIQEYDDRQNAAGKIKLIFVPSTTRRCGGDAATSTSEEATKKASGNKRGNKH